MEAGGAQEAVLEVEVVPEEPEAQAAAEEVVLGGLAEGRVPVGRVVGQDQVLLGVRAVGQEWGLLVGRVVGQDQVLLGVPAVGQEWGLPVGRAVGQDRGLPGDRGNRRKTTANRNSSKSK